MNNLIDILLLVAGFFFSFFIPGFLIIETFFKDFPKLQKIPLYMILSVEVSTVCVYLVGLTFGLTRISIILTMLAFFVWLSIFVYRRRKINLISKNSRVLIIGSLIVYLIFFLALFRSIFYPLGDAFVMAADNWQDTAMHTSIIESITQGNFPPQAPYYSGYPLDYYYFVDFHSAILNILYGNFFPRILVFDNPFFTLIFFASVFALVYSFTRSRLASIFSSILATFYGNQMFTLFLADVYKGGRPLGLLAASGYALDFNGIYQITPMVDYFLQNRPMMFGLPAFVVNTFLIFEGFKKKDLKRILLAGIIVGLSIKFQLFSFLASGIAFAVGWLTFLGRRRLKFLVKSVFVFALPIGYLAAVSFLMFPGQNSIFAIFKSTFHWGPWEKQDILWHIKFVLGNFGIGLPIALLGFLYFFFREKLRKKWLIFTFALFVILFAFPYSMGFTIFNRDMFKFFYVATIPLSVLIGFTLTKIFRSGILGKLASVIVILSLIFTSTLTLIWSHENRSIGYSMSDYLAGMWIRNSTPQKSVFIGYPTVHSPASDIGGRLRVTSYTNWPYSHGFNVGPDSVFSRTRDIDDFFNNNGSRAILTKYRVDYVFYGPEELSHYPNALTFLNQVSYLKIRYNSEEIKIYEVQN